LPPSWYDATAQQGTVQPVDQPESAKLPDGHDDAKPWQKGFGGQTAQLETSNDRYGATVGIVNRCEARDAAAVTAAKKHFLGIF
jgi:hypothetical protein